MSRFDFKRLDRLLRAGKLEEAAAAWRAMAASGAGGWEMHLWLARLQERVGSADEAEETLRRLVRAEPGLAQPHVELARLLTRTGQPARLREAEACLRRALEIAETAEVRLARARLQLSLGDQRAALEELRRVLELAPDSSLPVSELTLVKREIARLEKGVRAERGRTLLRYPAGRGAARSRRTDAAADWRRLGTAKTLVVDALTRCNQRCAFCFERELHFTRPDLSLAEIERIVTRARQAGFRLITFIGGEITLAKWLVPAIELIKAAGLRVAIVTNGAALSSRRYVERLLAAGLDHVELSFLSHVGEDDRRLCGLRRGLGRRTAALQNLRDLAASRGRYFTFAVSIVLSSFNVGYLREMTAWLLPFGVMRVTLKMMLITDNVADPSIIPRYASLEPQLAATLRLLEERGIPFRLEDIPLCIVEPRYYRFQQDKRAKRGVGFRYERPRGGSAELRAFTCPSGHGSPRCARCALSRYCAGPQERYVQLFGDDELRPRRRLPRSRGRCSRPRSEV